MENVHKFLENGQRYGKNFLWYLLFFYLNNFSIVDIFIFLQDRETYKFVTLRKVMLSLLESRRELLGATLTQDQTLELQMKVISKIDWGNR